MRLPAKALLVALLAAFALVLARTAWVSDDAFITLRVVDNAVHGHGLRWNVAERVQVYTHPLWMLLLLAAYAVTREPFFTTALLGAACSLAAVGAVAWRWRREPWTAAAVIAPLIASRAYIDYSTSGLENPLTHLLLVAFALHLPDDAAPIDGGRMRRLSALAALLALNRLDAALLAAPALGWAAWRRGPRVAWPELLAGALPLVAWTAFAVVYYGLPYPNTALAKLATGVPATELAAQGLRYLEESLRHDPSTLVVTTVWVGAAAVLGGVRERALAAGALLYLAYTVKVGGDFMSGRFLAAPLLLGALAGAPVAARPPWVKGAVVAGALALSLLGPFPNLRAGASFATRQSGVMNAWGIADERRYYFPTQGWLNGARDRQRPLPSATRVGRSWRRAGVALDVYPAAGLRGFYGGPGLHVVDANALTDPLLARLPMVRHDPVYAAFRRSNGLGAAQTAWRIGHFARAIPEGYLATLLTGESRVADPELRALWERVALVTRGPVWRAARLRVVAGWLLGGGRLSRARPAWTPTPWSEAVDARPADVGLRFARASQRLNLHDLAGAQEDIDAALRADPANVEVLALGAQVRVAAGDRAGGLALMGRAVARAPRDPHLRSAHAVMLREAGDLRGAIAASRRALDGDPALAAAARARIGWCLLTLGDAAGAVTWLREAVDADPDNASWRRLLARAERAAPAP